MNRPSDAVVHHNPYSGPLRLEVGAPLLPARYLDPDEPDRTHWSYVIALARVDLLTLLLRRGPAALCRVLRVLADEMREVEHVR